MSQAKPIVFVVDDDKSVREALDSLLRSVGYEVVCFETAGQFLAFEQIDRPACLVLDVRMPVQSGVELQRELSLLRKEIPIVFVTGHGDIPMSVGVMKAGAVDFLTKPFREQDLLDAIATGLEKDRSRRWTAKMITEIAGRFAELTSREREIMRRVVAGQSNKAIAAELGLSEITVKVNRARVMHKTEASSLPELVRMVDQFTAWASSKRSA